MRVLLVPNTLNPAAVNATVELATWLAGQGFTPVLATDDAVAVGLADYGVAPSDIGEPVLVVALGGDGTILKAVHLLGEVEVPVLGVNFGRLGFLSGASAGSMREAVGTALAGEASIERRATLKADVVMDGRVVGTYRALNEVVVSRGASPRVVAFELLIDDHQVARLRATASSSPRRPDRPPTRCRRAVRSSRPGLAASWSCPWPRTPLRASDRHRAQEVIEIVLPDPSRAEACLIVDGELVPCRRTIDRVTVTRASHDVLLVKLDGRHFYDTVAGEFFGG